MRGVTVGVSLATRTSPRPRVGCKSSPGDSESRAIRGEPLRDGLALRRGQHPAELRLGTQRKAMPQIETRAEQPADVARAGHQHARGSTRTERPSSQNASRSVASADTACPSPLTPPRSRPPNESPMWTDKLSLFPPNRRNGDMRAEAVARRRAPSGQGQIHRLRLIRLCTLALVRCASVRQLGARGVAPLAVVKVARGAAEGEAARLECARA
jgi:hypothetical protein